MLTPHNASAPIECTHDGDVFYVRRLTIGEVDGFSKRLQKSDEPGLEIIASTWCDDSGNLLVRTKSDRDKLGSLPASTALAIQQAGMDANSSLFMSAQEALKAAGKGSTKGASSSTRSRRK